MFSPSIGPVGTPLIGFANLAATDPPAKVAQGMRVEAVDPFWGQGEFMYGRASATIAQSALCTWQPAFDAASGQYRYDFAQHGNLANTGFSLAVAIQGLSAGQYGWFQVSGVCPVRANNSIAAGTAFGIGASASASTLAAGKQVLNAVSVGASTVNFAKANAYGDAGATKITVPNSDGWFIGMTLSGTGVGASALILAITPDGKEVTVSVANSARIAGTVTGTATGFIIASLNRPFVQGQIT